MWRKRELRFSCAALLRTFYFLEGEVMKKAISFLAVILAVLVLLSTCFADDGNTPDISGNETTTSDQGNVTSDVPSDDPSSTEATLHIHDYEPATCETPKTCVECGATDGEALGHDWRSATCTSPKECKICGETEGSSAGHKYTNGKCSVCGAKDPNASSERMVWIPTNGGTKYHTKSSCSNMKNPIQVTLSEAISMGFSACKRCC